MRSPALLALALYALGANAAKNGWIGLVKGTDPPGRPDNVPLESDLGYQDPDPPTPEAEWYFDVLHNPDEAEMDPNGYQPPRHWTAEDIDLAYPENLHDFQNKAPPERVMDLCPGQEPPIGGHWEWKPAPMGPKRRIRMGEHFDDPVGPHFGKENMGYMATPAEQAEGRPQGHWEQRIMHGVDQLTWGDHLDCGYGLDQIPEEKENIEGLAKIAGGRVNKGIEGNIGPQQRGGP